MAWPLHLKYGEFLDSATIKQTYALWVEPTWPEERSIFVPK
jgi:hypothetical protein